MAEGVGQGCLRLLMKLMSGSKSEGCEISWLAMRGVRGDMKLCAKKLETAPAEGWRSDIRNIRPAEEVCRERIRASIGRGGGKRTPINFDFLQEFSRRAI